MQVHVTRDSVCMGDDCEAPHARAFALPDDATWAQTVAAARANLATIAGGDATWLAVSGDAVLAVVAQQWEHPRWLVDPAAPAREVLHFRYLAQRDPDEVHAELRDQPASRRHRQ